MIDKRKDIEGAKAGSKPKKPYIQKDTVASTQTAEIVYGIGEGENAGLISGLQSIILDGTRVVGANGEVNYNEVKYEERVGLIEQEPLKLIEDTATERTLNLEVKASNPVVSTFNNADVDKFVVRMSIPQLMQNKDNGDSVATSVTYAIDIAVDGGPFVEVLNHTVSEKITNGYEIEHELDTPEGSVRLVRVRRLSGDSTSQMLANKTYVAGIIEVITAKFTHPALHYVGLTFNAENFNGIPKAVFHYKGRKIQIPTNYNPETRTYTGIWDGTFKVMYSNNPAWVLYDMLTHRRFGLGRRIPNELVDKWELYRIGAYCDEMVPDGKGGLEPRFVCNNLVLNSKEDAYKVIKDMASIFRGQAFWNGTQVITSADIPRDVEYAISMASVKDYSYSGTSRAARHNVIKVQYYDKANEYKAAYEFATDYDSIRELGEINELEIRAFGCDSPGQAQRLARYTLLSEQTETRILTATIALDGMVNMQIGDIFAWSDRLLAGAENGGRVVAVNGLEVTLDRDVTNSALVGDTLYVNTADGKAAIREITAVAGNKITVDQELPNVEQEFVWVIDSEQLSLLFFRLDSVRVSPVDNVVEITGTQHVNSKFAAVDTETALEAPPFSKVEIDTLRAPENVTLTYNVRVDQGINIADLYVAWGQVKGATRYTVEFRRDQQPWRTLGVVTGLTHTIENVSSGVYEVRVRATDALGNISPFGFSAALNVAGMVLPPPALASFTAIGELLAIRAKWSFPEGAEASLATVIEYTNQDPASIGFTSQTMNVTYPQTEYVFNGLGAHTQLWMRGGLMDKYGQVGAMTGWVSAVADANPEQLIDLISGHINEGTLDQVLKEKIDGAVADADSAGVLAASAASLANDAKTAAANAQTTADDAGTAAANAQATATNAANAVAKEVTDRVAAVTAEANARAAALTKEANDRTAAITKEATDRAAAINKEATDRAAALAAQDTALKADSAAKVKALKDEVDPKITSLQNGITQVTTDYKAGDTAVVGQLNAYKTSNDTAVASVLQKAESAVSTGATNSSAITAINGQIATINNTKLDASVISGYYTKGQTDAKAAEIAAGKVDEFSAKLKIGGSNLYYGPNPVVLRSQTSAGRIVFPAIASGNTQRFNYLTEDNLDLSGLQVGDPTVSSIEIFVPSTDTSDYTIQFGTYKFSGSSYVYAPTVDVKTLPKDTWVKLTTASGTYGGQPATSINLVFNMVGRKTAGDEIQWRNFMMEKASTASDFKESDKAIQSKIDANSTAIQTTDAEVARVDGRVTAANEATTALAGRVSTVEGAVATKAEAAALTALTTRVTEAEGVNTSQGSAITTLQNTVNHSTTGLATKASTSALTAVDNKVTAANGRIDTTNSNVTALQGRVDTVEGAVATKAEAAALTALTTRVGNTESTNTSQGSAITTLQNTVNHSTTGLATKASTAALTATNSEVTRIDGVVSGHTNQLTQLTSDITAINGTLATKANASALNDIYTKTQTDTKAQEIAAGEVNKYDASLSIGIDNLLPTQFNLWEDGYWNSTNGAATSGTAYSRTKADVKIPMLAGVKYSMRGNTRIVLVYYSNADARVGSYDSGTSSAPTTAKVVTPPANTAYARAYLFAASGVMAKPSPFNQQALNDLELMIVKGEHTKLTWQPSSVGAQAQLDANATAIDNTNSEVSRVDGRVTTEANRITSLSGRVSTVEGQVATKAEAAALSSLTTRVTEAEGVNTSQGSAITTLQNTVNHATTGLATKASSAALTAVDNKVTAVDGRVNTTNSNVATLTGRVDTVEGAVATKASADAVNALTTRVGTVEGGLESASSNITSLTNSLDASISDIRFVPTQVSIDAAVKTSASSVIELMDDASTTVPKVIKVKGATSSSNIFAGPHVQINPNTLYKVRYKVKRLSGTGTFYLAVMPLTQDKANGVNNANSVISVNSISSTTYPFGGSASAAPVDVWKEGVYYIKGISAAGASGSGTLASPRIMPNLAAFLRLGAIVPANTEFVLEYFTVEVADADALDAANTAATSAAISATNSEVARVDGRVTTTNSNLTALTGRVSTVEGALTTKADVSALNDIYTKSQTDAKATEIAAGQITDFKASLKIGAKNLLKDSGSLKSVQKGGNGTVTDGVFSTISNGTEIYIALDTHEELDVGKYTLSVYVNSDGLDKGITVPYRVGGAAWTHYTYYEPKTSNGWVRLSFPVNVTTKGVVRVALDNYRNTTGTLSFKMPQLERGEILTDWSPSATDVQNSLDANASAIDTTNTEVARVDGRVTTESNRITTLAGRVSTVEGSKADVSALNALTSRVGTVEGGLATQVTNTNNLTTSLAATDKIAKDALPQISSSGNYKLFRNVLNYYYATSGTALALVIQTPITFTSKMFKVTVTGYNYSINRSNINLEVSGYAYSGTSILNHGAINHGTFPLSVKLGVRDSKLVIILLRTVQNWSYPQFNVDAEIGYTTAPDTWKDGWSVIPMAEADFATNGITAIITPTTKDMPTEVAANASAISTTDAAVSRIDGVVRGHTTDISNLTTSIAGKADASALNSLTSRVEAEEGKSLSQGQAITNLENSVNSPTTGLATKASAQALTTLNNQVQHSTTGLSAVNTKVDNLKATVESPTTGLATKASAQALTTLNNQVQHSTTGLSAVNSKVDNLKATVENTTTGLASKASSAALDTLSNKVNHSTTGLDAIANKTTVLESDVSKALDIVTVKDTRSTNQPPSWYWTNYPRRVVNEFKSQTAIGVSGFFGGTYCNLETKVYYSDSSGGHLIQTATSSADPSLYVQRVSTSTSAWSAWAQPIKDLRDSVATKAAASAVESLTTRVSTAEGNISSEATKLSNLSTTVGGHTTTINSHTSSINGISGVHALKIETNGVISGYGLVSELVNGQVKSQFGINADSFFIGAPSNNKKPFTVLTSPGIINGVTVPAGTYIDTAFIGAATIGTAHINDLAVTTAKIGNGQITTAKIGDAQITAAKIGNAEVSTLKIDGEAVTAISTATIADYRREQTFVQNSAITAIVKARKPNYSSSTVAWLAGEPIASFVVNPDGGGIQIDVSADSLWFSNALGGSGSPLRNYICAIAGSQIMVSSIGYPDPQNSLGVTDFARGKCFFSQRWIMKGVANGTTVQVYFVETNASSATLQGQYVLRGLNLVTTITSVKR